MPIADEKKKERTANKLMLDALRGFVIRTANGNGASPEAVRTLPGIARVVLDYEGLY